MAILLREEGLLKRTQIYATDFNPLVLEEFAKYMHAHRKQEDGSLRNADNWQKGIPKEELLESLLRHVMDIWIMMESEEDERMRPNGEHVTYIETLSASLFGIQALMLEYLKRGE
jgi:hypothetical protein